MKNNRGGKQMWPSQHKFRINIGKKHVERVRQIIAVKQTQNANVQIQFENQPSKADLENTVGRHINKTSLIQSELCAYLGSRIGK